MKITFGDLFFGILLGISGLAGMMAIAQEAKYKGIKWEI